MSVSPTKQPDKMEELSKTIKSMTLCPDSSSCLTLSAGILEVCKVVRGKTGGGINKS